MSVSALNRSTSNSNRPLGIRSPNLELGPRDIDPNIKRPTPKPSAGDLQLKSIRPLDGSRVLVGDRVYRIEKSIGKGSFKTAYLASAELDFSRPQDDLVATANKVTLLVSHIRGNEEDKKTKLTNLRREVEVLKNCKDLDGVVQLIKGISFFPGSESDVAIVTEYCDAGTLNIWAKGKSFQERLQMLIDLAKVIQRLHVKGLAHRDIKPANICIKSGSDRFVPRIIDLGSMCLKETPQENQVPGTASYMPKVISDLKFVKHDPLKHDVYSLGITICEILADKVKTNTFLKSLDEDCQRELNENLIGFFNKIGKQDFERFINSLDDFLEPIKPLLKSIIQEDVSKIPSIDFVIDVLEEFSASLENSPLKSRRSCSPTPPSTPRESSPQFFQSGRPLQLKPESFGLVNTPCLNSLDHKPLPRVDSTLIFKGDRQDSSDFLHTASSWDS